MNSPISMRPARRARVAVGRLLASVAGICCLAASVGVHAGNAKSSASATFVNGSSQGLGSNVIVSTPNFSFNHLEFDPLVGSPRFAEGVVQVGTGGVGLNTAVILSGGPGVTMEARASGSFVEQFGLGSQFCTVNGGCQTLGDLGVSSVEFSFGIHASGAALSSRGSTFDRANTSVSYSWTLTSSRGVAATGGGNASHRLEANIDESFSNFGNGTAILRMSPGDMVELTLQAEGFSSASNPESTASALVTFANTLRWDGVQAFTAFDSAGQVLVLPTGQFSLPGQDTGFDYWQAASSPPLAVPEPATWLLWSAALAGLALRRRKGSGAARR